MKLKKFVFDIDGTICEEGFSQERVFAKPNVKIINLINLLHDQGNFIMLYTARGWDQYKITEHWLVENKVKYNILICGKPIYDYWIDDRALSPNNIESLYSELNISN
ncbi:MAG: hypothetical protein ISP56_06650 [Flavobacteriaceae bacterium]|nr:hypothetical protein [Flavobacteriaceae bacterium]